MQFLSTPKNPIQGIQKPLELTAHELWEGTRKRVAEGIRCVLLVVEPNQFRYVPESVVGAAQTHLAKTGDVEKVLRYLEYAFFIYRKSVRREWLAPHYKVDGAYEWPEPAKFSWSDIETVIAGGEYVHGPIIERHPTAVIESEDGDGIRETRIEFREGEAVKTTRVREILGKDELNKTLKYLIPDLREVGFMSSQKWQSILLKGYDEIFYWILKDLLRREISHTEAREHLVMHLGELDEVHDILIGRYPRNESEIINSPDLLNKF